MEGLADLIDTPPIPSIPLRWGDQPIDRYKAPVGRVVVAFPHLSRLPPFSGAERTRAAVDANKEVWSNATLKAII